MGRIDSPAYSICRTANFLCTLFASSRSVLRNSRADMDQMPDTVSARLEGISRLQLFAPRPRQPVVIRATIVFELNPLRSNPALSLHAVQRGIDSAVSLRQRVVRELVNPLGNRETVHGLARERLEDEHVQRPMERFSFGHKVLG